jgi:hypothetical protein
MRVIKLIAPTALIATLALFAPHAEAQTMGEYATTTASAGNGAGGLGTSIGSLVNSDTSGDFGGGSRTWGASSLGASFEERAGAASGSGAGADFESRAGSSGGASGSGSRWPTRSQDSANDRFADTERFKGGEDRFPARTLDSEDRFPAGVLDQNREGLDTHYSSSSGLDGNYSSSKGLDNSYSSN